MQDTYDQIVSIIPSETLKREIKAADYRLPEADLLTISFRYAADFDTRIQLLRKLENLFSGELKAYTARLINVQLQMLDDFMQPADDAVFELRIREAPDIYEERYLCRSYTAALQMISLFYEEYAGISAETDDSWYRIDKRRILSEDAAFSEDTLGTLILLPGKRVYSVDVFSSYEHMAETCDGKCLHCARYCVLCKEPLFPAFIRNGDPVKCTELHGKTFFGIACQFDDSPCSDCYVIPLDSNPIRCHDYANIHDFHMHFPLPQVERLEADDIPEELREDYWSVREFLIDNHRFT